MGPDFLTRCRNWVAGRSNFSFLRGHTYSGTAMWITLLIQKHDISIILQALLKLCTHLQRAWQPPVSACADAVLHLCTGVHVALLLGQVGPHLHRPERAINIKELKCVQGKVSATQAKAQTPAPANLTCPIAAKRRCSMLADLNTKAITYVINNISTYW